MSELLVPSSTYLKARATALAVVRFLSADPSWVSEELAHAYGEIKAQAKAYHKVIARQMAANAVIGILPKFKAAFARIAYAAALVTLVRG